MKLDINQTIDHTTIKSMSCIEMLDIFTSTIRNNQNLFHTKHNDGECECMFKYYKDKWAGAENLYYDDLSNRLYDSVEKIMKLAYTQLFNCFISTYYFKAWWHDAANIYMNHWKNVFENLNKFNWCPSDIWYYSEEKDRTGIDKIIGLIDSIREAAKIRKVVFISNEIVAKVKDCLGATSIIVPKRGAWVDKKRIEDELNKFTDDNTIFVWCAGASGKVWANEIFIRNQNTTHIDMGHTFDLAVGIHSRSWHNRDSEFKRIYCSEFIPYIKRSIK